MGTLHATEYANAVEEGLISLRVALIAHLGANHCPRITPAFVPSAMEAIEHSNKQEWDCVIILPNGLPQTTGQIVEAMHLNPFLAIQDECDGAR